MAVKVGPVRSMGFEHFLRIERREEKEAKEEGGMNASWTRRLATLTFLSQRTVSRFDRIGQ